MRTAMASAQLFMADACSEVTVGQESYPSHCSLLHLGSQWGSTLSLPQGIRCGNLPQQTFRNGTNQTENWFPCRREVSRVGWAQTHLWTKKMLPAIPANNDVAGHQAISHCRCPDSVCWGEFRKEKNRMVALDSLDAYQENNLNESRLSHLPIHKKAQKSLTCNVCFLWLAVIFCCGTTCFCFGLFFFPPSKASHISWLSPNLFWTVPQSYLRGCHPRL